MSDLIRRQDAVEAVYEALRTPLPDYRNDFFHDSMSYAIEIVNNIPSAEPERRWIPFDVALPKNRQKVLCVNKHDEMMVGGYLTDYGMTFPCYYEKPVAWMPLPEPWRGDR